MSFEPQRIARYGKKRKDKQEEIFGSTDEMMLLADLATSPASQGRGYGSALVRTMAGIVSVCALGLLINTDFASGGCTGTYSVPYVQQLRQYRVLQLSGFCGEREDYSGR